MTSKSIWFALLIFVAVVLTDWGLDTFEGKAIHWVDVLIIGTILALTSLLGDYWRGKRAH